MSSQISKYSYQSCEFKFIYFIEVLQAPSSWNKEIYTYDLSEREFTKIRDLFIKTIHDFGDVLEIDVSKIKEVNLSFKFNLIYKILNRYYAYRIDICIPSTRFTRKILLNRNPMQSTKSTSYSTAMI